MKTIYALIPFILLFSGASAQVCSSNGNIVIYSNYDGGYLIIDVNQDIPNLKVGITSYEPVEVTFTGAFVGNITEVLYAGYNPLTGTGNFHCDNNLAITSIAAPPGASLTVLNYPPVTLISPDVPLFPGSTFLIEAGNNGGILGCYSCENDTYQGGANTSEQIIDYFATQFNGQVRWLKTQYECWCGVQNLNPPTDCCTVLDPDASVFISADPGLNVCDGSQVVLDAGPGFNSYQWSTGANTQTINVSAAGNYSVFVQSDCGSASANVTVTLADSPQLNVVAQNGYDCLPGQIEVTVTNPGQSPGPYDFVFSDGNGAAVPSVGGLAQDLAPGTYTVEVTSIPSGCTTAQVVEITEQPAFTLAVTSNNIDCDGGPTGSFDFVFSENLTDTYTYQLEDEIGAIVASGSVEGSVTASGLPAGTYQLFIEGALTGCSFDTTLVISGGGPQLVSASIVDVLCAGDADGVISVVLSGGTTPLDIEWTDAQGTFLGSDLQLVNLSGGSYQFSVIDGAGCTIEETFTVGESPALALEALVQTIRCAGGTDGSVTLSASGGTSPLEYSLDGGQTYQDETVFIDLGPGDYQPLVSDANGCLLSGDPISLGDPEPLSVVLTASSLIVQNGFPVDLAAVVAPPYTGAVSYVWTPGLALSCQDCPNPRILGLEASTQFTVLVTNESGCTASASLTITVIPAKTIFIPNAFTPDFDGINDYLEVYTAPGAGEIQTFQVYDRWGGLMYDWASDGSGKGWDGRVNGKPATAGVYGVIVEFLFIDGELRRLGTDVTLVR